jgi:hypothetical protein
MELRAVQAGIKVLWAPALLALLFPVALCFFNQPTIDDYWYTWMVKEHGFWQAQVHWMQTINARFTSNAFMSLNSLVWGHTWFFKIFPLALLGGYFYFFYRLCSLFMEGLAVLQRWQAAVVLTCAYVAGLPGFYEGLYWSSALAGYQLSWLCMVGAFMHWYRLRHRVFSNLAAVGWCLAGIVTGGFHELVAFTTVCIGLGLALYLRSYWHSYHKGWLWFVVGALVALVFQVVSKGNHQKAVIMTQTDAARDAWVYLLPFVQVGYHTARGILLNPAWWLLAAVVGPVSNQFWMHLRSRVSGTGIIWGLGILLPVLAVLPAWLVGVLEGTRAPLRVIHLGYSLLFLASWVLLGALWHRVGQGLLKLQLGFRYPLALQLVVAGGLLLKLYQVVFPLANGSARQYHAQVQHRLAYLAAHQGPDTARITCLQAQPWVLCPVDVCNDPTLLGHLQRVYQKPIVVQDSVALPILP